MRVSSALKPRPSSRKGSAPLSSSRWMSWVRWGSWAGLPAMGQGQQESRGWESATGPQEAQVWKELGIKHQARALWGCCSPTE